MNKHTKSLVLAAAAAVALSGLPASAASADPLAGVPNDGLIVAYDFSETSGTVLSDAAAAGGAQNGVIVGEPAWRNGMMRFTGSNHVKLPDNLLAGSTAATVVVEARPDAATLSGNNFLWNIGGSGNAGTGQFFVHTPGHRAAISRTDWSGEQNAVSPAAFAADRWQSIVATIAPNAGASTSTLTLYVDGVEVARKADSTAGIANLTVQTNNVIGASAYTADPRFQGAISSYRLYDRALTAAEVTSIAQTDAATSAQETVAAITLGDTSNVQRDLILPTAGGVTWTTSDDSVVSADGTVRRAESGPRSATLTATANVRGQTATRSFEVTVAALPPVADRAAADLAAIDLAGLDDVRDNLTLPEIGSEFESELVWSASPEGVISTSEEAGRVPGLVTRPAAGAGDAEVVLTARVPGTDETRDFAVTVRQLPKPEAPSAYLFAHFTSGLSPNTINEQIYFAASGDGVDWTDLNAQRPVLQSTVGEQGARDPFLVRAPGGDKFYLLATDLSTARYGWRFTPENPGSKNLVVWESTDLVSWSEPRLVDVASKIPQAGAAWAPEAIYDAESGEYLVYWATASGAGADHPLGNALGDRMNMYYATTRDFVTFSDPVKWIDRTSSIIDTTVIEVDGVYYRASGDGQITIEASTDPYAVTVASTALADNPGGWERVATLTDIFGAGYSGRELEGPEFFAYNPEDWLTDGSGKTVPTFGLIADQYRSGRGYLPFRTTDLSGTTQAAQGGAWSLGTDIDFGGLLKRHGTVLPVTQSEHDRLMQTYGDASTRITSIAVTTPPSKTSYVVGDEFDSDGLVVTASTADGTQRALAANEYTLSGFDADTVGTSAVTVSLDAAPAITTSFTVTVGPASELEVTAAVTSRCIAGKVVQVLTVKNADDVAVSVSATTAYGSKNLGALAAGKSVSTTISTRQASIPAGTATVTASATIDGNPVAVTHEIAYVAASCG